MMENMGAAFAPRTTRMQEPMQAQAKFNMPSIANRAMTPGLQPASGMQPAAGIRPPRTAQPGMRSASSPTSGTTL